MVTVWPGWLAGVGEVQRYKVTSQHQPQPTPPPLPGSARARATRTNTAHTTAHRTLHTVHYTLHTVHTQRSTHGHTVLAPGPLSPLRVLPARPAAAAAQWWCAGRDLETRNQSGGWRWLASNTAAARGTTEKIGNQAEDRTVDTTLATALAMVTRPSTGRDHWPLEPGWCWATQGPRPRSQAQVTRVTPRVTCHVSRGVTEEEGMMGRV